LYSQPSQSIFRIDAAVGVPQGLHDAVHRLERAGFVVDRVRKLGPARAYAPRVESYSRLGHVALHARRVARRVERVHLAPKPGDDVIFKRGGAELLQTAANNVLMRAARAPFLILVGDMLMTQPGWNLALACRCASGRRVYDERAARTAANSRSCPQRPVCLCVCFAAFQNQRLIRRDHVVMWRDGVCC